MKPFGKFFLGVLALSFFMFSCATVQTDLAVSDGSDGSQEGVFEIEERLVLLDGRLYAQKSALSATDTIEIKELISSIDEQLEYPLLDKSTSAKLSAFRGRAFLLLGNKSEAKKSLAAAKKKFENETQCVVLARRLGEVSVSAGKNTKSDNILILEAALEEFDAEKYDVAFGLFDEAFLNLPTIYRNAYIDLRNKAWNLRDADIKTGSTDFWSLKSITVSQMLEITQNNSSALDFYTGGKKQNQKQLFQTMKKAGFVESDTEVVTRISAARFLWKLYTTSKNIDAEKYSKRYKARANAKSPIADVEIENKDFDAVMGTIENEIMSLIDGKNFAPNEKASALDFGTWLKNLAR